MAIESTFKFANPNVTKTQIAKGFISISHFTYFPAIKCKEFTWQKFLYGSTCLGSQTFFLSSENEFSVSP